ncbi:MAG: hypothetical protein R2789_11285 [Microthrixaceae bacterium]
MHIGSQVFSVENFLEGLRTVAPFVVDEGLPELIVGGGLGVAYVEGEEAPTLTSWAGAIIRTCREAGITASIAAEPGQSIVAQAAVTLYEVGTIKFIPGVHLCGGGRRNERQPRPVLCGSGYETFCREPSQRSVSCRSAWSGSTASRVT